MTENPTKVLDALQNLVVQDRVVEGAAPLNASPRTVENFRAASVAECNAARQGGAHWDHLRRVEARGPGSKTRALGPYEVELVSSDPLDATDRLRVWQGGHLLAEVELARTAMR